MLALQAQSIEHHGKREAARVGGINLCAVASEKVVSLCATHFVAVIS